MCGIAGFTGRGDRGVLERMTSRLAHRGPDAAGYFVHADAGVHLGHRRLSIIDHGGGQQPMTDEDAGLTLVFNGEIYNFRELRKELEALGARFRSDHSDTEVLLQGYRHWGAAVTARLNGMWAFVLYDRHRQRLFCSRDRFGKKPFYYRHAPGFFAFASELSALTEHPDVPRDRDITALRKYFAYGYIPAPLSLIDGVCKLPAGCSLEVALGSGRISTTRYWRYEPAPDERWLARPHGEAVEALAEHLDRAVARRLVADVPVGVFLSGGVDSSTIAALAMRKVGHEKLKAFSIGFDEAGFDESEPARKVAAHIGADHQLEMVSVEHARTELPSLLAGLDEPVADSSILPTWLLCRHARRQVTVALGGDGADELLGGYDPFKALRYARWYERFVPRPMHRAISALAARLPVSHGYMSFDFRLKRMLRGLDHPASQWLPAWMAPAAKSEIAGIFAAPFDADELYSEAIDAWDRSAGADDIDRATCFFVDLYLQDDILAKVDRSSMLNSLEVRAPFLDIDLVDFTRQLPSAFKLRDGTTKWLLKQHARTLLPHDIVDRRKQGFALPIGRWFAQSGLGDEAVVPVERAGYWRRALAEHRAGKIDHRLYLWCETVLAGVRTGRVDGSVA
jgi:asparagine synthase (glutamine-hydrolysing)